MLEHLWPQPRKPERAVIVGAGGFVGGAITKRVVSEGIATRALTRNEVDLLTPDGARKLAEQLRPEDSVVVVSAIAPAKTVQMLMQNLRIMEAVCEALAAKPPAHVIYISSDAVYADDASPVSEASSRAPSTVHGMMHAARELMILNATSAPVAVLRPTLIYGANDPHNGYGPNRFRRQAEQDGAVSIFGEGEERRDHIIVDDVAQLAAQIMCHRSQGALNAATGVSTSFHDIAHMVAAQYGMHVRVTSVPRLGPRPHLLHRFFDITNCLKAFPAFRFTALCDGLLKCRS